MDKLTQELMSLNDLLKELKEKNVSPLASNIVKAIIENIEEEIMNSGKT